MVASTQQKYLLKNYCQHLDMKDIILTIKKHCNRLKLSITGCVLFLSLSMVCSANTQQELQAEFLQLAWSDDMGQGEQIFFSRLIDSNWTIPVQISGSDDFVFHPTSGRGSDGKIWVVWSQADKKSENLYYSVFDKRKWSKPERIKTGMKDNRFATIIVEGNSPIIAWTATAGEYSDIFWCRWDGKKWGAPTKAHSDNMVPDLHPALEADQTGHIRLVWQTYVNDEYVTVSKHWDRVSEQMSPTAQMQQRKINIRNKIQIPDLPEFIKEAHKANIFIQSELGTEVVPLNRF